MLVEAKCRGGKVGVDFSNVNEGANTFDGGVKIGSMISIVVDTFVRTSINTSRVVEESVSVC
jgi:hypothetical protein